MVRELPSWAPRVAIRNATHAMLQGYVNCSQGCHMSQSEFYPEDAAGIRETALMGTTCPTKL